jgi:hypothetical protein
MKHQMNLWLRMAICVTVLMTIVQTSIICQQLNVTGKVISGEDRLALIGVNVMVKGSERGTVTGLEGDFMLETNRNWRNPAPNR